MKPILHCLIGCAVLHNIAIAQPTRGPSGSTESAMWRRAEHLRSRHREGLEGLPADKSRVFTLNRQEWERTRSKVPPESAGAFRRSPVVVSLPMPDGSFQRFAVMESPVMAPELAARFPQIKTYVGQGIDDPIATVRLDSTPSGLHAQVLACGQSTCVEPLGGEEDVYVTYDTLAISLSATVCETTDITPLDLQPALFPTAAEPAFKAAAVLPGSSVTLRTYRLAIAASGEFTARYGGTVESALAAIVTMVNRLNGVYETEFAFRMQLVANNHLIIYTNAATDPYSLGDASVTVTQNQNNLDAVIGSANYDLGQVFTTAPGGRASAGACLASKGTCTSGFPRFASSLFEISTFLHEMGHQFGARHTWNGAGCQSSEYRQSAAYEPGSGSTIMSYAGTCSSGNFQILRESYFHSISLDEIFSYTVPGGLNNCAVLTVTDNTPPLVNAGRNYTIPRSTPFVLSASGLDPDGDALTFCWEQRDVGLAQSNPGSDFGTGPLFRSFAPSTSPARTFPQLPDLLANRNSFAEVLPTQSRTLHFRVTARDNRAGGGGIGGDDTEVLVITNAGPFLVTAPNSAVTWSGNQTVTWSVAGTTNTPINALAVNIRLSTNGGWDFPFWLATNTPNDGSETVLLPPVYTTQARIKVEAVDNIFFDVSNTNFTVLPLAPVINGAGTRLLVESCSPANGAIDPGETVTVSFVLQNIGLVASSNLIASLVPTDDLLFPSGPQTIGSLAPQARSTNSFSFISHAGLPCGGTMAAFVDAMDGSSFFGRVEFLLTVGSTTFSTNRVANTNRIVIADVGPGAPYPSSINVSNLAGEVATVRVTLSNMNHSAWGEVDVLLEGPEGQTVLLLSETGAYGSYSGITLTFDDAAASPVGELASVTSGVFKPSNYFDDELFAQPAPDGPYGEKLSVFQNTNPNGTWRLFVVDDWEAQDAGSINGGWSLQIVSSETDCCRRAPLANDLSLTMSAAPNSLNVGEVLTYHLALSNSGPTSVSHVVVTDFLPATLTNVLINASQGSCLLDAGLVVCQLGPVAGGSGALVTISAQSSAPGSITNRAAVTADQDDGNLANNTARAVSSVEELLIDVRDQSILEGNGTQTISFTLELSTACAQMLTVRFETADGSALAGSDYVATNGSAVFLPGQTRKLIQVQILGDSLRELDETFFLHLIAATRGRIANGTALGTIRNDDIEVTIGDVTLSEGNIGIRQARFPVGLSEPSLQTVTVGYVTANGTATGGRDYAPAVGRLTFPPGATNAEIVVLISGDKEAEPDERFVVRLFDATGASFVKGEAIGTILNDDGIAGQIDHFVWSVIPSPQYQDYPFAAVVTARDAVDLVASNFTGRVALGGLGSTTDRAIESGLGTWIYPLLASARQVRVQTIYLASELGGPCRMSALSLDVTTLPGQTLSNFTLRLQHTSLSNYVTGVWWAAGWTLVHQTNVSMMNTGWVTFPFSVPFDYDGSNNLVVDFSFNQPSTAADGNVRFTARNANRTLYNQANGSSVEPVLWWGSNSPAALLSTRTPNLRFAAQPFLPIGPATSESFVGGAWIGLLTAPMTITNLVLRANDGDGHSGISSSGFNVESSLDADGDGLIDVWELRYFGATNAANSGPADDPDHDGLSNRQEFVARRSPLDPASTFKILSLERSGEELRINFESVVGCLYRLEAIENVASTNWEIVSDKLPGTGLIISISQTNPKATWRAYRLRVLP